MILLALARLPGSTLLRFRRTRGAIGSETSVLLDDPPRVAGHAKDASCVRPLQTGFVPSTAVQV